MSGARDDGRGDARRDDATRDEEPATAPDAPSRDVRRRPVALGKRLLALALVALVSDQLLLHLALADGEFAGLRVAPFWPPLLSRQHEESLAWVEALGDDAEAELSGVFFDPLLGWCPQPDSAKGLYAYDAVACRLGAAPIAPERTPGRRRVVLVGGSFARGDEVAGGESWSAVLDARLDDVEVANLGVGAFGIDQAWLRLRREGFALQPDEVWVAFFPQATTRLLNVYRPALQHHTPQLAFKPRFLLAGDDARRRDPDAAGGGARDGVSPDSATHDSVHDVAAGDFPGLTLSPLPIGRLTDMPALLRSPERFAAATAHDRWIARDPLAWSPPGWHPLQSTALGRLALTLQVRADRRAGPLLLEPDGELPRLVEAIVRGMAADAARHGARFRVAVLPGRDDLRQRRDAGGVAPWDGVSAALRARGLDVFDASETLLRLDALDPSGARRAWMGGGHYSPSTNAAVAEALLAHLDDGAAIAWPR